MVVKCPVEICPTIPNIKVSEGGGGFMSKALRTIFIFGDSTSKTCFLFHTKYLCFNQILIIREFDLQQGLEIQVTLINCRIIS